MNRLQTPTKESYKYKPCYLKYDVFKSFIPLKVL